MDRIVIQLLGRKHHVTMPMFAVREEFAQAWLKVENAPVEDVHLKLRLFCAAIAMSTRIGRMAEEKRITYAGADYQVLTYGGQIYSWLREELKVSVEDITAAGKICRDELLATLYPRKTEVDDKANFSEEEGEKT